MDRIKAEKVAREPGQAVSAQVPRSMAVRMNEVCRQLGVTRSTLVREAIAAYLVRQGGSVLAPGGGAADTSAGSV